MFSFEGFVILGCCGSRILLFEVPGFSGGLGLGFCLEFEGKKRAERAFWSGVHERRAGAQATTIAVFRRQGKMMPALTEWFIWL